MTTSLSSLKASNDLKEEILEHQRKFFADIPSLKAQDDIKGYLFNTGNDKNKLSAFLSILDTHQIEVYHLNKKYGAFNKNNSYIIPMDQNQYRLIKGMFEQRIEFQDSLFYDVSAWTLPLAFDLNWQPLKGKAYSNSLLGEQFNAKQQLTVVNLFEASSYAYAMHWEDSQSPALLYDIQKSGLRAKVSTEPWTSSNGQLFERGTIVVPIQNQNMGASKIHQTLSVLSQKHQIPVTTLASGNTSGFQLGSPKFKPLTTPKPLLLIGDGVNAYEAGEVWHLLDQRMGVALPMITIDKFNNIDLSSYNTIIMVNGNYGSITQAKLKTWVQNGGNIITTRSAGKWASEAGLSKIKYKKNAKDSTQKYLTYNTRSKTQGAQRIGGAIFETKIDLTHPLGFGFSDDKLPIF